MVQIEKHRNQVKRSQSDWYLLCAENARIAWLFWLFHIVRCSPFLREHAILWFVCREDSGMNRIVSSGLLLSSNHRQIGAFLVKRALSPEQKREELVCVFDQNPPRNQKSALI